MSGRPIGSGVRRAATLLPVVLVVALGPVACERPRSPAGIVVITLDTTRADRLSPYGFMNVTLPHLERIAREGVVFAEILRARGFRTAAFVGSTVVDPDRGLQRGFDEYAAVGGRQRRGDAVVDDAIRWLDRSAGSPFLMWTHLYDPHRPYDPPEPFASSYAHNPYVGEIAFADTQIGRLLGALESHRVLDRSVIVIAGDHGESLGEHGERDHGMQLYEGVLHVPLMIRAPGLMPTRIAEVVRLTDVMPTILELVGVAPPPTDGVSLVPLMRGTARDLDLEAYAESLYAARFGLGARRAIRIGRYKLIEAPAPELYDLAVDRFEKENIHERRGALARAMAARIAAIGEAPPAASSSDRPIPSDLLERLGALGYLGGGLPLPAQR